MAIAIKIGIVVSLFCIAGISTQHAKKIHYLHPTTSIDSVKTDSIKMDSIQIDTIGILIPYKKSVHASYYSDKFNGRKTANGAIFDNSKYTAAHRTLKFGTKLKITNTLNGEWLIVTVNDRGPFIKGREIDLTKQAFMQIAKFKNRGYLIVDIEIVETK